MILVLEDDPNRVDRFRKAVAEHWNNIPLRIWPTVGGMQRDLATFLEQATLISIDHDLKLADPSSGDPDDGYKIAEFLAALHPCCPVLIHTSNADGGDRMGCTL